MVDVTAADIAAWMKQQLNEHGRLDQREVVQDIEETFGEEWVYTNDNGNPAINKKVLTQFRKITEGSAEWDRWEFAWHKVEPGSSTRRLRD